MRLENVPLTTGNIQLSNWEYLLEKKIDTASFFISQMSHQKKPAENTKAKYK